MKLITEQCFNVKLITEEDESKQKQYYVTGVFMQAETPNRNNRVYPISIIKREVENYNSQFVEQNRALGELGHPETPIVNLERVSHLIKELKIQGNDVYGKAKLIDTPLGNIAKNLIKEGVVFGMSTRGLGSLKEASDGLKEVQDDYQLNAIDIVADPSAPKAFVEGIMENREWIYENGILKAKEIENYKKEIMKTTRKNREEKILNVFGDFLKNVKLNF